MPHIEEKYKGCYNTYIKDIVNQINRFSPKKRSGHLNYVISTIIDSTTPLQYDDYNTLIGVLECAKLEYYRLKTALYEDKKIKENGSAY